MPRLIDADKVKQYVLTEGFYCDTDADKEYTAEKIDQLFPTVEAIPVEWIKQWRNDKWFSKRPIEERVIMAMGARLMLEDWEKENAKID